MRILFVDDEPGLAMSLVERLEFLGFVVDIARSQGDAIRSIHKIKYDIIITDMCMADSNGDLRFDEGISLIRSIRSGRLGSKWGNYLSTIPILVLSGDPHAASSACREFDGVRMLEKPTTLELIEQIVMKMIRSAQEG
jgi:CheY-like chemotaxis protein